MRDSASFFSSALLFSSFPLGWLPRAGLPTSVAYRGCKASFLRLLVSSLSLSLSLSYFRYISLIEMVVACPFTVMQTVISIQTRNLSLSCVFVLPTFVYSALFDSPRFSQIFNRAFPSRRLIREQRLLIAIGRQDATRLLVARRDNPPFVPSKYSKKIRSVCLARWIRLGLAGGKGNYIRWWLSLLFAAFSLINQQLVVVKIRRI